MRLGVVITGLAAGLALVAVADSAAAQSRSRAPSVSLSEANAARAAGAASNQRRGLRLTETGRWSLDLNVSEPASRERNLGDVEAGAYYRVNPNLRLGASAGLETPEASPAEPPQADRRTASRFRLESIFRF